MERIKRPMFRYGEADFDLEYLKWGLHDRETQAREAGSILKLLPAGRQKILDLACGVGTHAICWARQGHDVTGVDLSETFIAEARKTADEAGVRAAFLVSDIRSLRFAEEFDVVTWIESSFFDEEIAGVIHTWLSPGGVFIMDQRNPEHPRARQRGSNFRTWREESGRFLLESHETDGQGLRHDVWIEIDTNAGKIIERESAWRPVDRLKTLEASGFARPELHTLAGDLFRGGPDEYWLWAVARK